MSKVNIACALRWGVASVRITLLGVTHPIRDNISGAGHAHVGGSHPGPQGCRKPACGFYIYFVKFFKQTSYGMYL